MIRCNIFKGKIHNDNFVNPGRDAQPRRDEGFVLDHGNTGQISVSQSPDISVFAWVRVHNISFFVQLGLSEADTVKSSPVLKY
jgi:hypothetical protein